MNLIKDTRKAASLARTVLRRRRAYASFRQMQQGGERPAAGTFEIAVYFSDSHVNAYQMRQWYEPLQELQKRWPVVVLARNIEGAELLRRESGLHVVFAPKVKHLEQVIDRHPLRIVLYVNQNTKNFQMLRYGSRWHVFINHGESDKMYMTTNQIKAYDYAFIAGQAAHDRLRHNVWGYDVAARTFEIGRPQADYMSGSAPYPSDNRTVVLYAPTWEGDRPSAAYGSIISHGEALVAQLLESKQHRLVYRPHPRSGVVNDEYGAAHRRIVRAIEAANQADENAHHVYDQSGAINWQLAQSDVAICDISAMIYDRLAVGKPVIVTRPASSEAIIDELGYLQACEWLSTERAGNVIAEVERVLHDDSTQEKLAYWAEHYFGDIRQGEPSRRFSEAIETLMQRWYDTEAEMKQRQGEQNG